MNKVNEPCCRHVVKSLLAIEWQRWLMANLVRARAGAAIFARKRPPVRLASLLLRLFSFL